MKTNPDTKIVVVTWAYNAEKTLRRSMDSVLNQSFKNITYYIVDNASTDTTSEIIHEYSKIDSRVRGLRRDENIVGTKLIAWVFETIERNYDYFAQLDADDEYKHVFLEEALAFAEVSNLDIVCCGNDFTDAATGKIIQQRKTPENLILDASVFENDFPTCFQFGSTIWAHLFRASVLNNLDLAALEAENLESGSDTIFTLTAFQKTERIGILRDTMHVYYQYPQSTYRTFTANRFYSNHFIFKTARNLISIKCGSVSPKNDHFLHLAFMEAVSSTVVFLLKSDKPFHEITNYLNEIFHNKTTKDLLQGNYTTDGKLDEKLRFPVARWILSQNESRKTSGAKTAAQLLVAIRPSLIQFITLETLEYLIINTPDIIVFILKEEYDLIIESLRERYKRNNADTPSFTELEISTFSVLRKPDTELLNLLVSVKKTRPVSSRKLGIDEHITEILAKYPMLENVSADLFLTITRSVCSIIDNDFPLALEEFILESDGVDISDDDAEAFIQLGQNLSAAADDMEVYIYYKKLLISFLLDSSRLNEARNELEEFRLILPDDADFAELDAQLSVRMKDNAQDSTEENI